MRTLKVFSGLLFLTTAGLIGQSSLPKSSRYKMTVEVDTPEGLRTGSAVREVSYSRRLEGVYNARVRGEAVVVDLPGGKTLYALLCDTGGDPDYAARVADWALKADLKAGGANTGYEAGKFAELWPTQPDTESPLWQTHGPMLVRFHNEAEPLSVERVKANDFSTSFGSGVRLKRIVLETTRENITEEIRRRLLWLELYPEPSLHSAHDPMNFSLAATLKHGDFWKK